VQLNDKEDISTIIVHGDGVNVCETTTVSQALLLLIALYYVINLDYPDEYAQLLGLVQMLCLDIDFPNNLRSAAFTQLKESLRC